MSVLVRRYSWGKDVSMNLGPCCLILTCIFQDEEDVPMELRNTEQYRKILELKRLKYRKLKEQIVEHVGYKVRSSPQSTNSNSTKTYTTVQVISRIVEKGCRTQCLAQSISVEYYMSKPK